MGVRNGQNNCEGDGFLTFCGYNFTNTCVGSKCCADKIVLVVSKILCFKRRKLIGRVSSNVHDRVDVFVDPAKVLLVINLLFLFLLLL